MLKERKITRTFPQVSISYIDKSGKNVEGEKIIGSQVRDLKTIGDSVADEGGRLLAINPLPDITLEIAESDFIKNATEVEKK